MADLGYLVTDAIDVSELLAQVASPGCGGNAAFVGTVRRSEVDGPVNAIEYSAYEAMAGAEIDRILEEVTEQWPQAKVTMRHRLGRVPTGEVSVAVVAAAPHRDEAFAACRHVIEQTKTRVPIWKKEILESGGERWREDRSG